MALYGCCIGALVLLLGTGNLDEWPFVKHSSVIDFYHEARSKQPNEPMNM